MTGTVLVAEDDADQLMIRAMLLRKTGLVVLEAGSYEQATELIGTSSITCAVIDLHLPSACNGWQLIRDLKQAQPKALIFLLTGRSVATLQAATSDLALVDQVFEKGSAPTALLRRLKAVHDSNQDV